MFSTILNALIAVGVNSILINNLLLIIIFSLFVFIFFKESKNPNSHVHWTDIIVDSKTNKVSLTKIGQLWGMIISSWVIIFLTQTAAAYSILPLMFPTYLAFLGGTWAFNSYMKSKQSEPKEETR